jgi:hypothetical protein
VPADDSVVRFFAVAWGLMLVLLAGPACSRRPSGAGTEVAAAEIVPGSPDCYKAAGAGACPKDPTDPSGLPQSGAVCSVPVCKTCGSDTVPAYRDATGAPRAGWCICVEKSDGKGVRTYSCGPQPWGPKN